MTTAKPKEPPPPVDFCLTSWDRGQVATVRGGLCELSGWGENCFVSGELEPLIKLRIEERKLRDHLLFARDLPNMGPGTKEYALLSHAYWWRLLEKANPNHIQHFYEMLDTTHPCFLFLDLDDTTEQRALDLAEAVRAAAEEALDRTVAPPMIFTRQPIPPETKAPNSFHVVFADIVCEGTYAAKQFLWGRLDLPEDLLGQIDDIYSSSRAFCLPGSCKLPLPGKDLKAPFTLLGDRFKHPRMYGPNGAYDPLGGYACDGLGAIRKRPIDAPWDRSSSTLKRKGPAGGGGGA